MGLAVKLDFAFHGNYCGPGYTRGKRHPERRMFELPYVAPVDSLDAACMRHDTDIALNGTSRSSDLRLAAEARRIALTNPRLRTKALMVAAAMDVAAATRKNQS
tara:strand:- start:26 stop:337 length:312 start_codon:yes stop_codon:yes gene_type:complete